MRNATPSPISFSTYQSLARTPKVSKRTSFDGRTGLSTSSDNPNALLARPNVLAPCLQLGQSLMSLTSTLILGGVLALYAAYLLAEFWLIRRPRYTALQLTTLVLVAAYFHLSTGFPIPVQSFGSKTSLLVAALMGICIILGMLSSFFFFPRDGRGISACVKPLLVSPIILLPLLGLVKTVPDFSSITMLYLCLISYQNGFFWKVVFRRLEVNQGDGK